MNICAKCGASGKTALTRTRLAAYETTVLGMPVVLVNAVDQYTCKTCGHAVEVVANNEGLVAAVALCRTEMTHKLNGEEIRLLRLAMGLKGNELAKKLDVDPATISRWENGEIIGNVAEKRLRLAVALALRPKAPAVDVDLEELMAMEITPIRPTTREPLELEVVRMKADHHKSIQWDMADQRAA